MTITQHCFIDLKKEPQSGLGCNLQEKLYEAPAGCAKCQTVPLQFGDFEIPRYRKKNNKLGGIPPE